MGEACEGPVAHQDVASFVGGKRFGHYKRDELLVVIANVQRQVRIITAEVENIKEVLEDGKFSPSNIDLSNASAAKDIIDRCF